ncbi:uncharacterized protein LOC111318432 [Durio zibethinus]|uniref:Uncharacterized protein LOC111318432 n=1 Tax=Durio zibethinus TaxID=66656 RepID=A0A6P6BIW2_DURZI|nr:uncharacterized protein LOC111318432 [Durio zibethinus]
MVPLHSNPSLRPIKDIKNGINGQHVIKFLILVLACKFAIIRSTSLESYHGAAAKINLQNPPAEDYEYTKANIWVQHGLHSDLNSIEVGWAVNPTLYGDNHTRLTTFWTVDNFQATGCYNALCPGYLQIDRSIFLGNACRIQGSFQGPSGTEQKTQKNSEQKATDLREKGRIEEFLKAKRRRYDMRYWARELFNELGVGALKVQFGGATKQSPEGASPAMGNGIRPSNHEFKACYFTNIGYARFGYNLSDVDPNDMAKFVDSPLCYNLNYFSEGGPLGQTFTFGGPGGAGGICTYSVNSTSYV